MIRIPSDESDDPPFIDAAEQAISGVAALTSVEFVHVVEVDSWFGDRWFAFAGKVRGALGVHDRDLKVPPFHPHRIITEVRFRMSDPPEQVTFEKPLHAERSSESNLRNSIGRLGDSIVVAWYSGSTLVTGRGALMVYASTADGAEGWYAGFQRGPEWRLVKLIGADERQWAAMLSAGAASR